MSSKIFTLKMHISFVNQARDTFVGYMQDDPIESLRHNQAVDFLRKCSPYETLYSTPGSRCICLHRFKAIHSDCRRKIYVRPLDESKYSTQLEDHKFSWSQLYIGK